MNFQAEVLNTPQESGANANYSIEKPIHFASNAYNAPILQERIIRENGAHQTERYYEIEDVLYRIVI